MEQLHPPKKPWRRVAGILGGLAIMAGIVLAIPDAPSLKTQLPKYEELYEQEFTAEGQCLYDSPYDPAEGAAVEIQVSDLTGEDILSVEPQDSATYNPASLSFIAANNELTVASQQTGSFLVGADCANAPTGGY